VPLTGQGLRPTPLRRRLSRPQLKRDPLGSRCIRETDPVNRAFVLHELAEAHEALSRMLHDARHDPEWGIGDLAAEMPHLYHHLNTAWNARDTRNAVGECTPDEFRRWSAFPSDLPMFE